ncbi:hypothetical protein ABIA38_003268 [Embleya sp. AB8]
MNGCVDAPARPRGNRERPPVCPIRSTVASVATDPACVERDVLDGFLGAFMMYSPALRISVTGTMNQAHPNPKYPLNRDAYRPAAGQAVPGCSKTRPCGIGQSAMSTTSRGRGSVDMAVPAADTVADHWGSAPSSGVRAAVTSRFHRPVAGASGMPTLGSDPVRASRPTATSRR